MSIGTSIRTAAVAAFAALLLGGCVIHTDAFKAKCSRSEDRTVPATDITRLDVATNVGTIRMNAADGAEIRIAAEIKVKAPTEEEAQALAEEVRIAAEPSGGTLTVKVVKPARLQDNNLSVDFTITAPPALALICTTNVGDIRVTDFIQRVKAGTNVGTITGTGLRGPIDLHANIGDIHAAYASDAAPAVDATLATDVGSLEFTGPLELSARVAAGANVGRIHTNRPLTVSGSFNRHSVQGSLGKGEGRVHLNTNVGDIRIR
jgi:hypothetical protein